MIQVAVVGSGPAGFYTAEACLKRFGEAVRIDMIERLPVPYGLIRSGVAPDHQSIKAVTRRYAGTAEQAQVRFLGNVMVGRDVAVAELLACYDAVVIATGAPADRPLGVPGSDLPGVLGSAAFVGWYNGHSDFAAVDPPLNCETVAIVGHGNVALDVARILAKTHDELAPSDIAGHALEALSRSAVRRILLLGRRGPHQIAMTPKELVELGALTRAAPSVDPADMPPAGADAGLDPGQAKAVALLRRFAVAPGSRPVEIAFRFFASPVAIRGRDKVEAIRIERTRLDADGRAAGTGETEDIRCGLVVSCIGYRSATLGDLPYDERQGRFVNEGGRIGGAGSGLYCAGWARRGPTGTIGTNRPDGLEIAAAIELDSSPPSGKPGREALDRLLAQRGIQPTSFADWRRIEAAEMGRARTGAPREKFVAVAEMLAALRLSEEG